MSKNLDKAVEDTLRELKRNDREYRRGLRTREEYGRMNIAAFREGFWSLLERHGLELELNGRSYPGFAAEFRARLQGGADPAPESEPWLLLRRADGSEPASPEDRRLVLWLMERYRLGPELFAPCPEQIQRPEKIYCHCYHDACSCSVSFRCADDGGLLNEAEPVGKRFRLVSERGLAAELKILEHRQGEALRGMDFDEMASRTDQGLLIRKGEYLAEGRIEGYTARERNPEHDLRVLIRLGPGGKIDRLSYWEYSEDRRAFAEFPLWEAYFRWEGQRSLDWEKALFDLSEALGQAE